MPPGDGDDGYLNALTTSTRATAGIFKSAAFNSTAAAPATATMRRVTSSPTEGDHVLMPNKERYTVSAASARQTAGS